MRDVTWNGKVAKKRGEGWRSKLISGRLDAAMNPTKLRLARIKKGASQEQIAKVIGVPTSTYGSIERGKLTLKKLKAAKLATHLRKGLSDLFVFKTKDSVVAKK